MEPKLDIYLSQIRNLRKAGISTIYAQTEANNKEITVWSFKAVLAIYGVEGWGNCDDEEPYKQLISYINVNEALPTDMNSLNTFCEEQNLPKVYKEWIFNSLLPDVEHFISEVRAMTNENAGKVIQKITT